MKVLRLGLFIGLPELDVEDITLCSLKQMPGLIGALALDDCIINALLTEMLKGKLKLEDLQEKDVVPNVRQKGVDMRIGVDVSSLAFKGQVDQIVLIAGDADFVPSAKQARREGIDFILDPMWAQISPNLQEHIDGLRSTCPRPKSRKPNLDAALVPELALPGGAV